MRKWAMGALAALLCAGLAGSVVVADDADKRAGFSGSGLFTSRPKVETNKPATKATATDEAMPEHEADVRAREQKAYLRRLQVCDRLLEIALEAQDEALQKQVEELNRRAFEVYIKRTGGSVGGARFEEPDGAGEGVAPETGKPGKRGEDKR
jgi:hypothetical protein